MKKSTLSGLLSFLCLAAVPFDLSAALSYWDSNGATPGAGTTPTGTWGTSLFWSTDSTGSSATAAWTSGDTAVFAAGTDGIGTYTVTLNGTQAAAGINVEEGNVTLGGSGAVNLGSSGQIVISSGATLSTDSSLRISATAGTAKATINGGTLKTTNPSNAGTFLDTDIGIVLGAAGGTFSQSVTNILNIQTGVISGSGNLTKTGRGVLAFAGAMTYTGSTTIDEGELRVRTINNVLPITTAVNVINSGILNLNGLNQTIASLSGNGNVGTGAGTLTINGSASTTFDGAIKNITNSGASGVTSGNGRLIKSGSGVITFNGLNDISGSVTLNNGGIIVNPGASLAGSIADITVNGGTLTLNNAAQTIENLAGTGGSIVLGSGHTLTSVPTSTANTTNFSTISGSGNFILNKAGAKLALGGTNTYTGTTTISAGTLALDGSGSIANSSKITVAAGAILDASTRTDSTLTLSSGQRLTGSGTVVGTIVVGSGSALAPGSSPGTLTTGNEVWNGGGTYAFEINDASGTAGGNPGWDLISITGGLTINATALDKFNINVISLTLGNAPGDAVNFDNTQSYAWKIASASGGITGFDSEAFNLDTSGFSNPQASGSWFVSQDGNDMLLNFAPVPEPSTVALGLIGGAGLAIGYIRRRRATK